MKLNEIAKANSSFSMPGTFVILTNMADFDDQFYKDPHKLFGSKLKDASISAKQFQELKDELLNLGVSEEAYDSFHDVFERPGNAGGGEHVHFYDVGGMSTEDMRKFAANFNKGKIGDGYSDDPANSFSSYIRVRNGINTKKLAKILKMLDDGDSGQI